MIHAGTKRRTEATADWYFARRFRRARVIRFDPTNRCCAKTPPCKYAGAATNDLARLAAQSRKRRSRGPGIHIPWGTSHAVILRRESGQNRDRWCATRNAAVVQTTIAKNAPATLHAGRARVACLAIRISIDPETNSPLQRSFRPSLSFVPLGTGNAQQQLRVLR
jgi:hypothetical protein